MKTKKLSTIARIWLIVLLGLFASKSFANAYAISGPYTKNNLSMYLIHGQDTVKDQAFLTLGEAMQQKKVKVYETSKVNQLSIENVSQNEYIYIEAGDIVKGGKQDRVFSNDMVLEPRSGKVDIASFCVEHGRWSQRAGESANQFHSSTKKLASKQLRLAARLKRDQSEVWQEVAKVQEKLGASVGQDVTAKESASSLQLTLENKQLSAKLSEYKSAFLHLLANQQHVIGYAFAINGQLNTADIFANQVLLKKLWPKIVDAAATESVSEYDKSLSIQTPKPKSVQVWLKQAEQGKKSTRQLKPGLTQETVESGQDVRFDTYSVEGGTKKLYRQSYIKK